MWDDVSRTVLHGDAWPHEWTNFGPGIAAAFLGGDAHPSPQTMWFSPGRWQGAALRDIQPRYDPDNRWWRAAAALLLPGIMLFAGNLYLLALTQSTPATWLTPLGGLCMISAWLVFAVGALTMRTKI